MVDSLPADQQNNRANTATEPAKNLQDATPTMNQSAESTTIIAEKETVNEDGDTTKETIMQKADKIGDKFSAFQSTLEKFGFAIEDAKRSAWTVLLTFLKLIGAGFAAFFGFAYENWELTLIAVILIIAGVVIWELSGRRTERLKQGMPEGLAKELAKE